MGRRAAAHVMPRPCAAQRKKTYVTGHSVVMMSRRAMLELIENAASAASSSSRPETKDIDTQTTLPFAQNPDGDARWWLEARSKEIKSIWHLGGSSAWFVDDESDSETKAVLPIDHAYTDVHGASEDDHKELMHHLRRLSQVDDQMQKKAYFGTV